MSTWSYDQLQTWIRNGCQENTDFIELLLGENELISIPPEIGQLQNLTTLYLGRNELTSIPPEIGQLQRLTKLYLSGNPIEHYPINVQRLMMRQRWVGPSIYTNTQSVHTSSIQSSIKESILRLLKEKNLEKDIIPLILSVPDLEPFTKESLIEYSKEESVHTELNVSFSDLLVLVWNRILVSPHSGEVKGVLNTEMRDAECKCFTGWISRLVNCLNGFDPLVSVQISDNEQIGAIISLVKREMEAKGEYTIENHKAEAARRLKDLQVNEADIEIWLSYIEWLRIFLNKSTNS